MCARPWPTSPQLWGSCRTKAGLRFLLMMDTLKSWPASCLRMSLLSPLWPHLTSAAMFLFVHLVCLLIQPPGGMTTPSPPSLPQPLSLFISPLSVHLFPGTGDLMKISDTTSDLSAFVLSRVIGCLNLGFGLLFWDIPASPELFYYRLYLSHYFEVKLIYHANCSLNLFTFPWLSKAKWQRQSNWYHLHTPSPFPFT